MGETIRQIWVKNTHFAHILCNVSGRIITEEKEILVMVGDSVYNGHFIIGVAKSNCSFPICRKRFTNETSQSETWFTSI